MLRFFSYIASTSAFTVTSKPHISVVANTHYSPSTFPRISTKNTELRLMPTAVNAIRGGCQSKVLQTLASSLRSGPYGVLSLFTYAYLINLPLTLYRQAYSFSVGYGLSIFSMAIACALSFRPNVPSCVTKLASADPSFLLVSAAAFYGLRLGLFLLIREMTVPSKAKVLREMDTAPRLKRVILSANVSLFYALLTGPIMYALRTPAAAGNKLALGGASLAWFGAGLEAITDLQKWVFNRGLKVEEEGDNKVFNGPTGWAYSVVRHPNYLGEVLFWTGIFVGGIPSFGRDYVAWIGSALGLSGIWAIMTGATKRLEGKQNESYKGQEKYESWIKKTRYPLIPFLG